MTSASPDPQPDQSTGLEPGGGVPPGETPPDSGSVSTGPTTPGSGGRNAAPWVLVGIGVVFVIFVALFFVGRLL